MFFHHAARSVPDRLLWCHDRDGLALFDAVCAGFPELAAFCLMPDHFHLLLPHADPDNRMHRVIAGYAHGLCQRHGLRGPLWAPRGGPVPLPDDKHLRRTHRYIHLNPCRARLVRDPLAWPFSTHRDQVGFSARSAVAPLPDPAGFHQFVSADPTVDVAGTPLPLAPYDDVTAERVAEAVASVWRVPVERLATRHPARRTFVHAAVYFGVPITDVTRITGLTREGRRYLGQGAVARGSRVHDAVVLACVRAVGDPRFPAMSDEDRRRSRAWSRYAHRR